MQEATTQAALLLPDTQAPPNLRYVRSEDVLPVREQMAADLSHELRTSLAIITLISGNLDLLYERLEDHERKKMIRDIRKHTQKLNDLVGDVLTLALQGSV